MSLLLLFGGITNEYVANITEGADTVAATATVALQLEASITEGADTVSASAAVALQAAAALTEGADTLSAAATVANFTPNRSRARFYIPATAARMASIWKGMRGS